MECYGVKKGFGENYFFFSHSLVRFAKELCQFIEKLVWLWVTCAAAPAPLVAPQHQAWVDFGSACHFHFAF